MIPTMAVTAFLNLTDFLHWVLLFMSWCLFQCKTVLVTKKLLVYGNFSWQSPKVARHPLFCDRIENKALRFCRRKNTSSVQKPTANLVLYVNMA